MMKEKVIFRTEKNEYISEQQYLAVFPEAPANLGRVLAFPFYFSHDDMENGKVWFEPAMEADISWLHKDTRIVHKDDARIPHLLRAVEEYLEDSYAVAEKIICRKHFGG